MQINEALNALNDGHTIWKVGYAKRVCKALGVEFSETNLLERFYSEAHPMGAHLKPGYEGSLGVSAEVLSRWVASELRVLGNCQAFLGRGTQAREYARAVREKLGVTS